MNRHYTGAPAALLARRIAWLLSLIMPLLFALLGMWLGKEAGWDLQNYHWYNPFAWLNGRLHFDLAVGHHATYHNPMLDVPLYLLGERVPAVVLGGLLGGVHGLNFVLLFWLGWHLLRIESPIQRLIWAGLVALAGMLGGGALIELAGTSHDNLVSLGLFAALLLLVWRAEVIFSEQAGPGLLWLALAGGLLGCAVGLKLTAVVYAVGFNAAFLFLPLSWRMRFALALVFGMGIVNGVLLSGGAWMFTLWQNTGNPLFPYFNEIFRSPLLLAASYRDLDFIPESPLVRLLFPLFFSFDPHLVAEFPFRDLRILAAFLLVPLALVLLLRQRTSPEPLVVELPARLLLSGAALSYLVWLGLFCIYRYLIPLEMLAPLLLLVAAGLLPVPRRAQLALAGGVLLITQLAVQPALDGRSPWGARFVEVEIPPLRELVAQPERAMVLTAGTTPVSYVIPYFPKEIPFLRIQGWLVGAGDRESGLGVQLHGRVAAHEGPFLALFGYGEREGMEQALAQHRLRLGETCRQVGSSIGEPLALCLAERDLRGD